MLDGCSTSVSPTPRLVVPKMENLDVLDQCSRPSLDHFRNTRQRMKKTLYVKLPKGAIIEVSEEDEGDMNIMVKLGVEFDKNKRVKEDALSSAELNAKLEQKMKEDMAATAVENAKKIFVIQEELRVSNAKTDAILKMLSRMQSFKVAPQPAYPFPAGYRPPGPFAYQPVPHPTTVGTPPPLQCVQTPPTSTMQCRRPSEKTRVYERMFVNLQIQQSSSLSHQG